MFQKIIFRHKIIFQIRTLPFPAVELMPSQTLEKKKKKKIFFYF